jgi:CheY-like chemotaxis protein
MGRLFQPFYFHKKSGHQMLSGLGLTLVLRVVENHAGFIDVHTAQGQGTEFVMAFPAASQGVELEPKEKSVGGMETILIVDDYLEQRLVASELLQSLGYRVLTAESGYAAVKLFEQHPPGGAGIDLVVMDLVLGDDFDGVETFKRILTHSPGQKAVLVSGFADLARIGEARKLGVGECIQKPYTSESLGRAIRKVIDGGTGYSEKV